MTHEPARFHYRTRGTVVWATIWPSSSVKRTAVPGWAALASDSPEAPR